MEKIHPFKEPIYVTRPILPDTAAFYGRLDEVWKAQWLTNNGAQHQLLEEKLREVLKVPSLSLFNNGTIALIVAVQSLRLSGEVITTPFTFAATPHVLSWNNIKPIFCDIDPKTLTIDAGKIESMITPKTTAILGVHVYGVPCDVERIQAIADKYGLRVIYDAAHAFGTELGGVGIGNWGDITMFSFHATKLFHTGEGGALCFRDPNLKARVDLLKNFGIKSEDEVVMPGINGKMNEIQAALGLSILGELRAEREKRQALLDVYTEKLSKIEGVSLLPVIPNSVNSLQYFIIRIDEKVFGNSRDYVYAKLKEYNVFTRKYFYPLCSDYACYSQLPSSSKENLPVANRAVKEVLALPFYGGLPVETASQICEIIGGLKK